MRSILYRYILTVGAIYLLAQFRENIIIEFIAALFVLGLVSILVDAIVKPLALVLAVPVSLLTMGLFVVIVNAWLLMLADAMTPYIQLGGFLNGFLVSLIVILFKDLLPVREEVGAA